MSLVGLVSCYISITLDDLLRQSQGQCCHREDHQRWSQAGSSASRPALHRATML